MIVTASTISFLLDSEKYQTDLAKRAKQTFRAFNSEYFLMISIVNLHFGCSKELPK